MITPFHFFQENSFFPKKHKNQTLLLLLKSLVSVVLLVESVQSYPSKQRPMVAYAGRFIMACSSWDSFKAAALTRRVDFLPILFDSASNFVTGTFSLGPRETSDILYISHLIHLVEHCRWIQAKSVCVLYKANYVRQIFIVSWNAILYLHQLFTILHLSICVSCVFCCDWLTVLVFLFCLVLFYFVFCFTNASAYTIAPVFKCVALLPRKSLIPARQSGALRHYKDIHWWNSQGHCKWGQKLRQRLGGQRKTKQKQKSHIQGLKPKPFISIWPVVLFHFCPLSEDLNLSSNTFLQIFVWFTKNHLKTV